jgi:hypothetical protein
MVPNCVPVSEIMEMNSYSEVLYLSEDDMLEENLRKWFKQKWVNIGKKDKDGKHPPCGTSGKKRGYAKCVPASKAASMSKKEKQSATRRKRAAQNKAGRGGTSDISGGGKKPIRVSTKPKKKRKSESKMSLSKKELTEMIYEEYVELYEKKDACYHKVKARYDVWPSAYASGALSKCRKVGAANWGNKSKKESVEEYDVVNERDYNEFMTYMKENYWTIDESCGYKEDLEEAEYQGRKVKLGKPTRGDSGKFKVYVKNPKGNVVKVNFGAKGKKNRIKKSNPNRRKSFRARHNCDNPGPRHKARYWSCRKW